MTKKMLIIKKFTIFVKKNLNDDKVWDHCHITGKYRRAANDNCIKKI